jgi:3-phenylpropionate/trans-cinnamate dioxygenase ferredoxin subunit
MKKLCNVNEIAENSCKMVEIDGMKIALYKLDGKIHAIDAECTHMKGPLCKGRILQGKYVQCPWHGATFNIETGEAMSGPTKQNLKVYKIKVEKDEIYLDE